MAASHMSGYAEVVTMDSVCVRIVVVAAIYAGLALLVIVLHARVALVKPKLRHTHIIVEL